MQGEIVSYHLKSRAGMIRDRAGKLYIFSRADWLSAAFEPLPKMAVQFEAAKKTPVTSQAFRITPSSETPWAHADAVPSDYHGVGGGQVLY